MSKVDELRKQIDDTREAASALLRTAEILEDELVSLICPYKVGKIVTNSLTNRKAKITRIEKIWRGYRLFGKVVKTTGVEGSMERELYQAGWPRDVDIKETP